MTTKRYNTRNAAIRDLAQADGRARLQGYYSAHVMGPMSSGYTDEGRYIKPHWKIVAGKHTDKPSYIRAEWNGTHFVARHESFGDGQSQILDEE